MEEARYQSMDICYHLCKKKGNNKRMYMYFHTYGVRVFGRVYKNMITLVASGENWTVGNLLLFILFVSLNIISYEYCLFKKCIILMISLRETMTKEKLEKLLKMSLEDDGKSQQIIELLKYKQSNSWII